MNRIGVCTIVGGVLGTAVVWVTTGLAYQNETGAPGLIPGVMFGAPIGLIVGLVIGGVLELVRPKK